MHSAISNVVSSNYFRSNYYNSLIIFGHLFPIPLRVHVVWTNTSFAYEWLLTSVSIILRLAIYIYISRTCQLSKTPQTKSSGYVGDIQGKYSWRIFTKVPSNNSFPIPFVLVTTILLCCDHVFVRKIVCKINQTKSHGLFSNQSSNGHWETCFHLFWYSDCNYQIIVQWHRYR